MTADIITGILTFLLIALLLLLTFRVFRSEKEIEKKAYKKLLEKEIICPNPNCDYKGIPEKKEQGNSTTGILLLLFGFILPGLLYFMFYRKTYLVCPKCGIIIRQEKRFPLENN